MGKKLFLKDDERYLIVKCDPLSDQYECDANRTPLFICNETEAIEKYADKFGYEIYFIQNDRNLELIKEYEEGR